MSIGLRRDLQRTARTRRSHERYRPPAWSGYRVRDLRAVTLGDLAARATRHRHYVALIAMVLVVAVWFPGDLPINRAFQPGSSDVATPPSGQSDTPVGAFDATGDDGIDPAADLGSAAAVPGSDGGPGDTGFAGFDVDDNGSSDADVPDANAPRDPDGGGSGCAPDDAVAEGGGPAVVGPTLEQARAAQLALEEQFGQAFPVDVTGTAASAAGCQGGAAGVADLLALGAYVPLNADTLLSAIHPVIAPACGPTSHLAVFEASVAAAVSPAVRDALALCVAATTASHLPDTGVDADSVVGETEPSSAAPGAPTPEQAPGRTPESPEPDDAEVQGPSLEVDASR